MAFVTPFLFHFVFKGCLFVFGVCVCVCVVVGIFSSADLFILLYCCCRRLCTSSISLFLSLSLYYCYCRLLSLRRELWLKWLMKWVLYITCHLALSSYVIRFFITASCFVCGHVQMKIYRHLLVLMFLKLLQVCNDIELLFFIISSLEMMVCWTRRKNGSWVFDESDE